MTATVENHKSWKWQNTGCN